MGSYRASVGHRPILRVEKDSPSFAGNDIGFTIAAPVSRTGIIYTADFSQFSAYQKNPQQASFDSGFNANVTNSRNRIDIRHIAQTGQSFSAAVAAATVPTITDALLSPLSGYPNPPYAAGTPYRDLPHMEATNTNPTHPSGSGFVMRGTVYYGEISYSTGGYQGPDKPRNDLSVTFLQSSMPSTAEYWCGIAVYLPADYVEDTASREQIIQMHANNPGGSGNHWTLDIIGGGSTAQWTCRGLNAAQAEVVNLSTPIVAAHKGAWTFHVFHWQLSSTTSAYMQYWLTQTGQTAFFDESTGTQFGWMADPTIQPSFHCAYKGSWRNDGTYNGTKKYPSTMSVAEFRIGDSSSNYSSVHPLQWVSP